MNRQSALADVRAAMAELRAYDPDESAGHEDGIDRAMGALERVEEALQQPETDACGIEEPRAGEGLHR